MRPIVEDANLLQHVLPSVPIAYCPSARSTAAAATDVMV